MKESDFVSEVRDRARSNAEDTEFVDLSRRWMMKSLEMSYSYNFFWAGRPIIQYPQDVVTMQEIVMSTKPDLIVETGIAHGGSVVLNASLLALLDLSESRVREGEGITILPRRKVIAVDIDIRPHNRKALDEHYLQPWFQLVEGSSTAVDVVDHVKQLCQGFSRVMVCLDSNHTHDHVLGELEAYSDLVSQGCYLIVFDTIVDRMPSHLIGDRPWTPNDNPMTAVREFLSRDSRFENDSLFTDKGMLSVAPGGFLRRIR